MDAVATLAWKVRVAVTGVVPSVGVTELGEMVQVELAGAPVQARVVIALKPPVGVMVMVAGVLALRATVAVLVLRVMVKSAAVTAVMVTETADEVEVEKVAEPP